MLAAAWLTWIGRRKRSVHYLRGIITWIDSLESGRQFRSWAAILCKVLGVVALVGISAWGIVICVDTIGASKDLEMTSQILVAIGSILEVCINIIVATVLAMLFWNRVNKIRTLDNDPNFILVSITVITIQLLGEISFLVTRRGRCSNVGGFNFRIGNSELLRYFPTETGTPGHLSDRPKRKYHFYLKCDFVCNLCSLWGSDINRFLFHSRRDQRTCKYSGEPQ